MPTIDRQGTVTLSLYVVLATIFCWPLFDQPLANASGDWDQHIFYYASVLKNAAFGDLPFWNPWYCGGNVLWANPQASLVSPVYLLALVMPLTLAMKLNVLAHVVAGCLGLHMIIQRIVGVKSLAMTVFLVALFAFSGAIALHVKAGHTVYLPVFLLPLVAYCFWQVAVGHTRSLVAGGAVIGFSILNGGMHVVPFFVVLLGALGVGALVFGRRLKPLVLAVAMFALGCALAAPRVVPALAFIRSEPFHDVRPVNSPDYMTSAMLRTAFFDASQDTSVKLSPGVQRYGWHEYGNYLGWFGGIAVAGSAIWIFAFRWRRDQWQEMSVAFALVVAVLLTAGEFAVYAPASLLRDMPLISSFRIPSRYTMLVPLAGALCAAFALRAFEVRCGPGTWRRAVEVLCIVGVVQIVLVNRTHLRDVFVLSAERQATLFERITPAVAAGEVLTAGGPRVHRTYMLDSMLAGVSPLNCYEPLRARIVAYPGPVAITGEGDVTVSASTFSPNHVTAAVKVGPESARVVLNQNFAEGWSSNVGAVERHPRTQLPSVAVSPGYSGDVSFRFVPPGLWLGLAIWMAAIAASIAIWRTSL